MQSSACAHQHWPILSAKKAKKIRESQRNKPDANEFLLSLPPLLLFEETDGRLRQRRFSSSSSELKPDESDSLTNTNVPTEDAGERVGSIGVSAGDTDSDPETVGVVDLSASFSATCFKKLDREFVLWKFFGGVPSPLTSLLAWPLSLYVLFSPPDLSFTLCVCGREACTSDATTVALVGNPTAVDNFRWNLGDWTGESDSSLVCLFSGAAGNFAPLLKKRFRKKKKNGIKEFNYSRSFWSEQVKGKYQAEPTSTSYRTTNAIVIKTTHQNKELIQKETIIKENKSCQG